MSARNSIASAIVFAALIGGSACGHAEGSFRSGNQIRSLLKSAVAWLLCAPGAFADGKLSEYSCVRTRGANDGYAVYLRISSRRIAAQEMQEVINPEGRWEWQAGPLVRSVVSADRRFRIPLQAGYDIMGNLCKQTGRETQPDISIYRFISGVYPMAAPLRCIKIPTLLDRLLVKFRSGGNPSYSVASQDDPSLRNEDQVLLNRGDMMSASVVYRDDIVVRNDIVVRPLDDQTALEMVGVEGCGDQLAIDY